MSTHTYNPTGHFTSTTCIALLDRAPCQAITLQILGSHKKFLVFEVTASEVISKNLKAGAPRAFRVNQAYEVIRVLKLVQEKEMKPKALSVEKQIEAITLPNCLF